ncbi:MAG: MBL fold metallo-hydrolase [Muribaculaceae bacterium]|nr:MBL fold metallo-hydrolase [Muribaculaceae bacterium]
MLKIKQFAFNPFGVNTYLVWDDACGDAIVVDPGMIDAREHSLFDKYIADNKLHLTQIVNTHLHLDHCFGDNYVRDRYGVKIAAHEADAPLGARVDEQAGMFGTPLEGSHNVAIDVPLHEGDSISVGQYIFTVLEVPGHSPGGIALYCKEARIALVGDSIFHMSIGRTDLPGGDHPTLIDALRKKILSLPDDTQLLTGHDRPTTVQTEKAYNPFLR